MRYVIGAAPAPPRLITANLRPSSARGEQDRMGCSTSSQTSAVDTTRPSSKPEESNGASTTGATEAANKNGKVAEDSETIPDQTPAADGDGAVVAAASASPVSAAPPAAEEPEPAPEAPAAAEPSPEAAAAAPEQESEATATEPTPTTDEAPAPSE
ncbi:brain acid soluble protein 1 [Betta splendens]|uniref:Brain acid soluble protein 1 n=1 Tax=Betta splendens TaxID=158456 RepID=A0A6P7NTR0_BETSP|nr:brain acid soluble protein 1 [Betta splendens]